MLTLIDLVGLLPLLIVASTAVLVMLGVAWRRHHGGTAAVTVSGLALALASLPLASAAPSSPPLMIFDGLALMGSALVLVSGLFIAAMSHGYLAGYRGPREEFYLLLLCAVTGALGLVASNHLATLFISLELLSMPLYGMVAYSFRTERSLEAGIKYLILSAAATAFLLFGMALIYARTGHLELTALAAGVAGSPDPWILGGAALLLVGLGFKLSIIPFHQWTPDVYQGGLAPATTVLATVSKLAVFLVLLRLVLVAPVFGSGWLLGLISLLALLSMFGGNLLALFQPDLKRLLGYSSIAHMGYLLVAVIVGGPLALETTGVYLFTYIVATMGAFGVIMHVSGTGSGEDASGLHHYRGLFWHSPWLAALLTLSMLSLAGIPLTAGFFGKFYIIALGVEGSRWWLVGGIVIGSVIGLFYYLRVIVTLYLREPGMQQAVADAGRGRVEKLALLIVAVSILLLGIYPVPFIDWVAGLAWAARLL
ncbi:NADH-quinone oxidoreductase subunit NuoN [Marinobacter flavimaris]|jgi:NADH-quinone oxidoreductase subunit N|uniref:NADH-quinone oxidoreductase subunit N n=6 Tax=Marinobacteraceae TaxID=2887365 RepID=A0A3D8H4I2_9GAMM|nr:MULTISPECIES: NADH-quinone oxidoreductase subunit NuoN [Marinobacter]MCW8979262.1 NADH-quinone oxidoreductase subunit NuoN [Marinobacter sp.]EHJ06469.1 proton-translocating NADH-quinone oxidoreductase subunit N [Marinobacter manganoxydans MnI7-9]MCW9007241.1 NADH-quinone oxidoreductase subunit NuoN [Marinobacter sp.]PPI81128.1 NADH-quinone oxidoreductase subunit NuoN [Marinobacter flavimaris]RDU41196.1 NADH-quinone oxidoreductase subunit NuoN [Marinobacter flavimaris]|tara:strand:+ start:5753 stop:7195 length:1443 start_codon:yes stop_codon:yes gene_type:complete